MLTAGIVCLCCWGLETPSHNGIATFFRCGCSINVLGHTSPIRWVKDERKPPRLQAHRSVMWTRQSQMLNGSLWYACMMLCISRESHGTAELPLRWRLGGGVCMSACQNGRNMPTWATHLDGSLVFNVIRKLLICHKMVKSECHQIKLWKQCLCWQTLPSVWFH